MYVESHYDLNITNNMDQRDHEYIALGRTVNIQWSQILSCLNLGIVLNRINIVPIIVSNQIIKIVEEWVKR